MKRLHHGFGDDDDAVLIAEYHEEVAVGGAVEVTCKVCKWLWNAHRRILVITLKASFKSKLGLCFRSMPFRPRLWALPIVGRYFADVCKIKKYVKYIR